MLCGASLVFSTAVCLVALGHPREVQDWSACPYSRFSAAFPMSPVSMPPPATQREPRLTDPLSCPAKPDRRWRVKDAIPYHLILIWSEDLSTCSQELWSSHRPSWSKLRKSQTEEQQRKTLPAPQREPLHFTPQPVCALLPWVPGQEQAPNPLSAGFGIPAVYNCL